MPQVAEPKPAKQLPGCSSSSLDGMSKDDLALVVQAAERKMQAKRLILFCT